VVRTAERFSVTGWCGNDDESVFIETQGPRAEVEGLIEAVCAEAPPLAHIVDVATTEVAVVAGEVGFGIVPSQRSPGARTLIPPDTAPCADCLAEMANPANRRYRYPFTTCTNCGPRLTIIRDVPYDRPLTTLADFPLCPACHAEYTDPANRRYHAQPISCYDCGPTLWFEPSPPPPDPTTHPSPEDPRWWDAIVHARKVMADGAILAVKGIGGFTLFADARNPDAAARLRQRKRRPHKPFAVMAPDLAGAREFADLSATQERLLASPQRPIVLAPMAAGYDLAGGVAPGLGDVGVMLPSAPLHTLLLAPGDVVIATSANISGEPLIYRNEDARRDLAGIVDGFVIHDRPIHVPVEDSVLMAVGEDAAPIRRSRGYAPLPVRLGGQPGTVLAVGGELKNTFTQTRDGMAFTSAHIGDMGSLACQRAFERSVEQMGAMHRRPVEVVAADLHPGYATTAWAERYAEAHDIAFLQVQHHHAHALALLGEHRAQGRRAAVAVFDGTGFGTDGTVWGGEILTLAQDPATWERAWHLPEFWLPGGDSAVFHPWKAALAVACAFGVDDAGALGDSRTVDDAGARPSEAEIAVVRAQIAGGVAAVRTTSAGRLFDAVAALLGVRRHVTYEAQAAMELERLARECRHGACARAQARDVGEVVAAVVAGAPPACAARRFHAALAGVTVRALTSVAEASGAEVLGLTGGVFQNRLFTADCLTLLSESPLPVLIHRVVPANDGGLSLGQALAGYLWLTARNGT
jgi:hydrogenase maturation protein HypF